MRIKEKVIINEVQSNSMENRRQQSPHNTSQTRSQQRRRVLGNTRTNTTRRRVKQMKKTRRQIITEEAQNYDADFETIEYKQRILKVLKRLGAAYLSEIAWDSGLTEYQTKMYLNQMYHDGQIQEEPVTFAGNPKLIKRVYDMSAKGQGGFANFSRKKWYSITEEGARSL